MFKTTLEKAKSAVATTSAAVTSTVTTVSKKIPGITIPKELEQYWDAIESAALKVLNDTKQENWVDDVFLTFAFGQAHGMLPLPLRLIIKEDTFVKACIGHKNTITQKLVALRQSTQQPPAPDAIGEAEESAPKKVLVFDEFHLIATPATLSR